MRRFYVGSWTQDGVMRLDDDPQGPFCYVDDAEKVIDRLLKAIKEFAEAFERDPIKYADLMDRTGEAVELLCRIAREGR